MTDAKPSAPTSPEPHTSVDGHSDCAPIAQPIVSNGSTTPVPIWDLLRMKNVRDALIASWLFALISIELEAVWLLWLYTPIQSGGIGLTVRAFSAALISFPLTNEHNPTYAQTFGLGVTFSFVGVFNMIALVFIFPPLQRRFGSRTLHIVAMWAHVAQVLLYPIVRFIAVRESGSVGSQSHLSSDPGELHGIPGPFTMIAIGVMVVAKGVSDVAYASISLLVNATSPNKASLGAVNGLMSMVSSLMRAVGPVAST